MKLAILGGSFNPIHIGHLFLAETVLAELHYDRVVLVPAFQSPFKMGAAEMESSARDRLEMAAAAIAGDPRLSIDDCEIRREGVSYTIHTIMDITHRYMPDGKPGLIIGDDLAGEFPQWHHSDEILALADIIVARRDKTGRMDIPYPHISINNDVFDVSSCQVREKIASDSAWRYMVPAPAQTVIEDRGLYGVKSQSPKSPSRSLILRIEEAVRESLSLDRFLHSRSVALMSWDLCCRLKSLYRLDPEQGYLAGIAHDLGKPLGEKELLKLVKHDGMIISDLEKEKPSLLHGRASAVLLQERFDVDNEDILEAVALHTSGGSDMGPLAKVVYIADKMEVSREKAYSAARKLVYTENDLDKIFFTVLEQNVSCLRARKLKLAEGTLSLLRGGFKEGGIQAEEE